MDGFGMANEKKKTLIQELEQNRYLQSQPVKKAFKKISREQFIPEQLREHAYVDMPLFIGNGQTISAPHMIAIMIEELELKPGLKVLEIGTGSGYHAALVSQIIGPEGHVYSIERFEKLAEQAKINLENANIENVTVKQGDGSLGLSNYQPYDRIFVTCAAPSIPQPLKDQLDDPGILLIPVGKTFCQLVKYKKENGMESSKNLMGCSFVPLVGEFGH